MSELPQLYEAKLYMKSGNVIELSNLLSLEWKNNGISKSIKWEHHEDDNTFNLLGGNALDLDQVEAITHKKQYTFRNPV